MNRYLVRFYKHLLDDYGNCCRPLQGKYEIDARNPRIAGELAEREFEVQNDIQNWRLLADSVEVELFDQRHHGRERRLLSHLFRRR